MDISLLIAAYSMIFVIVYPYLVYPIMLYLYVYFSKRVQNDQTPESRLSASVLLSVYNEEQIIEQKIKNFLKLDYPHDKLDLWIVSDGSTDRTNTIVDKFSSSRVNLLIQGRAGKTAALNKAAKSAAGEILVFTDANTFYSEDAIKKLVAPFIDPSIGVATGRVTPDGDTSGEGIFSKFEQTLKYYESKLGLIAGADGAIYAMRKSLYHPLNPAVINDFYHPIEAVQSGFKAVFIREAIAFEDSEDNILKEYARQKRMANQAFSIISEATKKIVLNRKWLLLWVLLSHKVIRWFHFPFFCILTVIAFLYLITTGNIAMLIPSFVYLAICLMGYSAEKSGSRMRFLTLLYKFQIIHFAYFKGILDYLKGHNNVVWEPRGGGVPR